MVGGWSVGKCLAYPGGIISYVSFEIFVMLLKLFLASLRDFRRLPPDRAGIINDFALLLPQTTSSS